MRKNLSEELEINDDISLDNGENKKQEEEKEDDKLQKEIQKDIEEKNKIADEIRDAEAEEIKITDGSGKALKIKKFNEKLTLEEPSNILTEGEFLTQGMEEIYSKARLEFMSNLNSLLDSYSYILGSKLAWGIDEVEEELYSAVDEGVYNYLSTSKENY